MLWLLNPLHKIIILFFWGFVLKKQKSILRLFTSRLFLFHPGRKKAERVPFLRLPGRDFINKPPAMAGLLFIRPGESAIDKSLAMFNPHGMEIEFVKC